jgi:hypothetical protein
MAKLKSLSIMKNVRTNASKNKKQNKEGTLTMTYPYSK